MVFLSIQERFPDFVLLRNMPVRIAVIGCGYISKFYIQAIQKNKDAHFIALCDVDSGKNKYALDLGVPFYTSHDELLRKEQVDMVCVLTPHSTHACIAGACIESGKFVVCEKPLTVSYKQTQMLIDTASNRGCGLMTAFHRRYHRQMQTLISMAKNRKIRHVHARYFEKIFDHTFGDCWYLDAAQGGGCVMDNGSNVLDCLLTLLGDLSLVDAHVGFMKIEKYTIDTNAYLQLKQSDGATAVVELDWFYPGEKKDISVYFEDGGVFHLDFLEGFPHFKESLWHEYEGVIQDAIDRFFFRKGEQDTASLRVSNIIDEVYRAIHQKV